MLVGWISAYRPPSDRDSLFIWQVAVDERARGEGLGRRMIQALLDRPSASDIERLTTTITAENAASWALFESVAKARGLSLARKPIFEREAHFAGAHATEWLVTIGPFAAEAAEQPTQQSMETQSQ